jgi:hypothetical protein
MKRKKMVATKTASFLAAAARGNPERGLRLLEKLNRQDRKAGVAGTKP